MYLKVMKIIMNEKFQHHIFKLDEVKTDSRGDQNQFIKKMYRATGMAKELYQKLKEFKAHMDSLTEFDFKTPPYPGTESLDIEYWHVNDSFSAQGDLIKPLVRELLDKDYFE
jgi:hypothetical protein